MAIPVLVILAVLWAVVLVPPLLRSRNEARRSDSVGDFSYRLGVLSKTGGHAVVANRSPKGYARAGMSRAQRRRRDVLVVLSGLAVLTLGVAAGTGTSLMWAVQILADALLVVYVLAIVRMRSIAMERRTKVAYLPSRQPELVLRRTGSS
ncbi:MAG TPA: hypothetical protein VFC33_10625 [Acidimicrobiia bacterium]|nr:hypothetical protein [Acidimicrobiia bacterium]